MRRETPVPAFVLETVKRVLEASARLRPEVRRQFVVEVVLLPSARREAVDLLPYLPRRPLSAGQSGLGG